LITPRKKEKKKKMNNFSGLFSSIESGIANISKAILPELSLPPWKLLPEEHKDKEEIIKKQILCLSKDKWNFLQEPPKEALVNFNFNFEKSLPVARATMNEDNYLKSLHFFLVPQSIQEKDFWRNYFAHVYVITKSLLTEDEQRCKKWEYKEISTEKLQQKIEIESRELKIQKDGEEIKSREIKEEKITQQEIIREEVEEQNFNRQPTPIIRKSDMTEVIADLRKKNRK